MGRDDRCDARLSLLHFQRDHLAGQHADRLAFSAQPSLDDHERRLECLAAGLSAQGERSLAWASPFRQRTWAVLADREETDRWVSLHAAIVLRSHTPE